MGEAVASAVEGELVLVRGIRSCINRTTPPSDVLGIPDVDLLRLSLRRRLRGKVGLLQDGDLLASVADAVALAAACRNRRSWNNPPIRNKRLTGQRERVANSVRPHPVSSSGQKSSDGSSRRNAGASQCLPNVNLSVAHSGHRQRC